MCFSFVLNNWFSLYFGEKLTSFTSTVKKTKKGIYYFDIPNSVMEKMKLKPFMACKMRAEKKQIKIFGFEKTVKIKVDLSRKTIKILKEIMKLEGYGSLDETVSNLVKEHSAKLKREKTDYYTVYIYPKGFLDSKYILIDDYEKAMKKVKESGKKR